MAMAWALGLGPEHGPWLAMANHDLSSACSQLCPSVVASYSLRGGVAVQRDVHVCPRALVALFALLRRDVQIESYVCL